MSPAARGVVVVVAGLGLTLTLGSLCVWVLIGAELLLPLAEGGAHAWSVRQLSIPFATAAAAFVVALIVGGRLQDRIGPRWPSTAGGVLIGLGMVLASMSEFGAAAGARFAPYLIFGLGLMVGGGAGLTLASVVPPALKWSVPRHHGLIVGIVLSGLALGPVWLGGPLGGFVQERSISSALLIQGLVLLTAIVVLSQLLENPLPGYVPPGSYSDQDAAPISPVPWAGFGPRRMMRTATFRALWASLGLIAAASSALGIHLLLAPALRSSVGQGLAVAVGLGGCIGAVLIGFLHDRSGQKGPWPAFAALAAILTMGALCAAGALLEPAVALVSASLAGAAVVAWVTTTECFGTRSVGVNVGLIFSGLAVGLLMGAGWSAATVGSAVVRAVPLPATTATALAFTLDLMLAVIVAVRVRPQASLGVVMRAPRPGRDSVTG